MIEDKKVEWEETLEADRAESAAYASNLRPLPEPSE